MRARIVAVICLLACLASTIPMVGQQRGPVTPDVLSGEWTGDWGPTPTDRNMVSVDLKWDGKTTLTGTVKSIQPSRPDVTLVKSTLTWATNTVHMEADSTSPSGGAPVHFIIDGKLANGMMTGSWNHDTTKGDFKLSRKNPVSPFAR